ncbi:hypothetical protein M440DRAFT_338485 [Trichoderma longibrachiatum ATCC 18648]|uniref:Uncharacterized protein n=1 Tax=Trichoderma longibrachiatum ATCC 18648 TaxID=983965 RepID=A0A2T4C0U2_TRILO|nr:hypothetical protein M440DRAFT_338485 [Trichoderma longibrachiatum ATCC 18648]
MRRTRKEKSQKPRDSKANRLIRPILWTLGITAPLPLPLRLGFSPCRLIHLGESGCQTPRR